MNGAVMSAARGTGFECSPRCFARLALVPLMRLSKVSQPASTIPISVPPVCVRNVDVVCTLCQVEFGLETLCPSCVAAGSGRARAANLITGRKLYDSMALLLSLVPLVLWPFTAVTAPATLFLSASRWREPLSLVRRNRWRFVAAILISLLQIAGGFP